MGLEARVDPELPPKQHRVAQSERSSYAGTLCNTRREREDNARGSTKGKHMIRVGIAQDNYHTAPCFGSVEVDNVC